MKTKKEYIVLLGAYATSLQECKELFLKNRKESIMKSITGAKDIDALHDVLTDLVGDVKLSAGGAVEFLQGCRVVVETADLGTSSASLTIVFRNKLKTTPVFSVPIRVKATGDDIIENVYDAFIVMYTGLAKVQLAQEIISEINVKLAEIKSENPAIGVDVTFDYSDSDSLILSITDTAVVFNASVDAVLDASSLAMFQDGDSFTEVCKAQAIEDYIAEMLGISFAPQVVTAHVTLFEKLIGYRVNRRIDKILRGTYHKNSLYAKDKNPGVYYYESSVGEKVDKVVTFALIEKTEDAHYNVVLSPFDARTIEKVKLNVLKELKLK